MKRLAFFSAAFISIFLNAAEHRHHGAHEHGAGKLGIAFDGPVGKMDFKIPSESIFGFEHEAKSAKDKAAQKAGLARLEQKISEMIVFDTAIQCAIKPDRIEVIKEKGESHSDTSASFSVTCAKSPAGTAVVFNFQKFFPKIKDLDVEVIADNLQKSIEAKQSGTKLELK